MVTVADTSGAATLTAGFNGSQSITVEMSNIFDSGISYSRTFQTSEFSTGSLSTPARTVPLSTWRSTSPVLQEFYVYRLAQGAGRPADYASIGELRASVAARTGFPSLDRLSAFAVVGTPTDPSAMPRTGSAAYTGTAVGHYLVRELPAGDFTAAVNFNADFATGRLTGRMDQFSYVGVAGPDYSLSFGPTTISGNQFSSGFSNPAGSPISVGGSATGQFYGPPNNPAAEMAGVFQLYDSASLATRLVGGFVAGK